MRRAGPAGMRASCRTGPRGRARPRALVTDGAGPPPRCAAPGRRSPAEQVLNASYGTDIALDCLDPARNATVRVTPHRAFALDEAELTSTPTRWTFDG